MVHEFSAQGPRGPGGAWRGKQAAGFPEYSAKDLRRYVASRLLDAGYSHDWIAKALGHAPGSRVTEGYSTAYDGTLTEAFRKAL